MKRKSPWRFLKLIPIHLLLVFILVAGAMILDMIYKPTIPGNENLHLPYCTSVVLGLDIYLTIFLVPGVIIASILSWIRSHFDWDRDTYRWEPDGWDDDSDDGDDDSD